MMIQMSGGEVQMQTMQMEGKKESLYPSTCYYRLTKAAKNLFKRPHCGKVTAPYK